MLKFNLQISGTAANVLELGTRIHALFEASPDLTLEHTSFWTQDNDSDAIGSIGSVGGANQQMAPLPVIENPEPDASPAAETKPKRTRASSKTPAQQAAAGSTDMPTNHEGLLSPLQPRVKTDDKGIVVVTEAIYFHKPGNNVVYSLQPEEPLVIMSGAVEVTKEDFDHLKAEYSGTKPGAAAEGNAQSTAPDSDAQAPEKTSAPSQEPGAAQGQTETGSAPADKPITDEELRGLSSKAVEAGKRNDVLALVKKYAIEAISKCPTEKRAALKADLEALIPATEDAALA